MNGAFPIDLTSDVNIRKLIKKCIDFQIKNPCPEVKYPFLKNLVYKPPKPPKTKGNIYKISRFLAKRKKRFIEVDPVMGSLRRYESFQKFQSNPLSPLETIPLKDIDYCKKIHKTTNFEVIYNELTQGDV